MHLLGVDDPNSARVFQATAEGLLLRRRTELKELDDVGRSKRRTWLAKKQKRHDAMLAVEGEIMEEEERDISNAKLLSDRCRADLAARKAAYNLERMEDERRRKEERDAKIAEELALRRDRELAAEVAEACRMATEDADEEGRAKQREARLAEEEEAAKASKKKKAKKKKPGRR